MNSNKYLLHELSWVDIKALDKQSTVFLLPVGSTEQHGPQNPLGTDFLIAQYVARIAAKNSEIVYCLPTLPIGVASHHRNFAGTLWLKPHTFETMVKEVIHSVHYHGFDKLIVVNGHGGNTASIMQAISEYNDVHDMLCVLFEWWSDEELIKSIFGVPGAVHADAVETSTVWAACPDLVIPERFEGLTSAEKWGREIGGLFLSSRTDQFTETGIAGSLDGISKDKGQQALDAAAKKLVYVAEELSRYKK
ncbi:MAG: creatininase family protein [Asgard group archaeon]|nr:creatininase family protein [Asgard group archaeon]